MEMNSAAYYADIIQHVKCHGKAQKKKEKLWSFPEKLIKYFNLKFIDKLKFIMNLMKFINIQ